MSEKRREKVVMTAEEYKERIKKAYRDGLVHRIITGPLDPMDISVEMYATKQLKKECINYEE